MLRKITLFYIFFFSVQILSAQSIETLKKEFFKHEKNRLNNAEKIKYYYAEFNVDSLYGIANFLMNEGIEKKQPSWLYYGKQLICLYFNSKNKLTLSYTNLHECTDYYSQLNDLENLAACQDLLGQTCLLDLRYQEGIHLFVESIQNHRKSVTNQVVAIAQLNLAQAFYILGKYEAAEKEVEKFIAQCKGENLPNSIRKGYNLLGKIYLATNRQEAGFQILNRAMQLAKRLKNPLYLASSYNLIAIAYIENEQIREALPFFEKALSLRIKANEPSLICESAFNLGELYFVKGDFRKAIDFYNQELKCAIEYKLLNQEADALEAIGYAYNELREMDQAFEFATSHAAKQDEIMKKISFSEQNINEVFQNQERLTQNIIQRRKELELEKRIDFQKQLNYLLFGASIGLLIILAWVLNRNQFNFPGKFK